MTPEHLGDFHFPGGDVSGNEPVGIDFESLHRSLALLYSTLPFSPFSYWNTSPNPPLARTGNPTFFWAEPAYTEGGKLARGQIRLLCVGSQGINTSADGVSSRGFFCVVGFHLGPSGKGRTPGCPAAFAWPPQWSVSSRGMRKGDVCHGFSRASCDL